MSPSLPKDGNGCFGVGVSHERGCNVFDQFQRCLLLDPHSSGFPTISSYSFVVQSVPI